MNKSRVIILLAAGFALLAAPDCPVQAEPVASSTEALPARQTMPYDLVAETPDSDRFIAVTVGEYFTCATPADWGRADGQVFGLSDEEKKSYGIKLQAPFWGEIPIKISVDFYAEGNLLYGSVDHYLRVFAQPALGVALEGSSYGAVSPALVSGREGMTFERVKNEYLPLDNTIGPTSEPGRDDPRIYERREMMARPVPVRERFVVLPASSGFYALRYSAPEEVFPEHLAVFEKVVSTFYALK
jgi:hypothetical protein